jgi:hypothetical protein
MNDESTNRNKLQFWLFIYGLSFAFWHIAPVLMDWEIKYKLTLGDLLDTTTPFILTGLVLKLFLTVKHQAINLRNRPKRKLLPYILLLIGVITFIEGHGIHIASNIIHRFLMMEQTISIYRLTYFLDENLSHVLWDAGFLLISLAFIIIATYIPKDSYSHKTNLRIYLGGLLYGFTYFCNAVEGQTVIFTFPSAVLIAGSLALMNPRKISSGTKSPLHSFFQIAYSFAILLFLIWDLSHRGFPEFSELGWI